ncbi:hypothetical protein ACWIG5_09880 [Streptomyces lydicus]
MPGANVPATPDDGGICPDGGGSAPHRPYGAPGIAPDGFGAPDADVWPHAVALDNASRATTGKPTSIWRLRTDLHIGPNRARQVHNQLQARHHDQAPRSDEPQRSAPPPAAPG